MEKKIYLDTNIFITHFLKRDGFDKINNFMKENKDLEVCFVTSDWTLTEIAKVLIHEYKVKPKRVAEYIQKLQREKRVFDTKFSFIEVSNEESYDFGEFFYHIQKTIIEYNNGLGDSIHSLIMQNNNIKHILTTNEGDFQGVNGTIAINPLKSFTITK
ncbi:type II toxin-antitoxin system VapC family toxin [Candidatus Pacearchaeota archaeon]|nr:type II toxin-antitoxin system VapC family toxin [Candidatus Pacearchaeota archaeon]